MLRLSSLVVLIGLAVSACDSRPSSDVATHTMYAYFNVYAVDNKETMYAAYLRDGPNPSSDEIHLVSGDKLIASIGTPYDQAVASGGLFDGIEDIAAHHKTMRTGLNDGVLDDVVIDRGAWASRVYYAPFPDTSAEMSVYVALERSSATNAPSSAARLPADFSLLTPASNGAVDVTSNIVLTWSPVDATQSVILAALLRCPFDPAQRWSTAVGTDTGTATFPANTFTVAPGRGCTLTLAIDRFITGSLDANFGGGAIRAHRIRSVRVAVN